MTDRELLGWTFQKIEDKRQTLADVPDGWEGLATKGDDSLVKLMRVENSVVYDIFGDGEKRPARLGKLEYRVYNPEPVKMPVKDVPVGRCFRYSSVHGWYMWLVTRDGQTFINTVYESGRLDCDVVADGVLDDLVVLIPRVAKWGPI